MNHPFFLKPIWTVCLLACFQLLSAQPLSFDHLTIEEGLSNNTVNAITQDQDGFLWLGTRDGLNRYDGYEFRVYRPTPDNTMEQGSMNVQALFNRDNGDLLIGLRPGGLQVFEYASQEFLKHPVKDTLGLDWQSILVEAIFQARDGSFWVGTSGDGVFQLDSNLQVLNWFHPDAEQASFRLSSYNCFSFCEDAANRIWIGTSEDFIQFYDPATEELGIVNGSIGSENNIFSYRKTLLVLDNQIWVGTEGNGLHFLDPETLTFTGHKLGQLLIQDIEVDQKTGTIYLSADGTGLFYSNDQGLTFNKASFNPFFISGLNSNALYDIFIDERSNIWIGTFNGGVNVYKPQKANFLTYLQPSESINVPANQSVLSFCQDRTGSLWIGKDGGGLIKLDPTTNTYKKFPPQPGQSNTLSSNVITSLFEDSKGNIWAGTFSQGVNKIGPDRKTIKTYHFNPQDRNSLLNNNVWAIEEDQAGFIWLGTLGGGLNRLDPATERFEHFIPDPADSTTISDLNIKTLLLDGEHLWVGTEFGGLNRLKVGTRSFEHWEFSPDDTTGLRSNRINCLHLDTRGALWVGTEGGGLHRMESDERSFLHFNTQDGLPSDVINAIEEDDSGVLWISTNQGISSLDPETKKIVNYDQNDGLQSDQFNPDASIKTQDGRLYFGGIFGFNAFNPREIKTNDNLPRVVFTDFQLLNQSVPIGQHKGRVILDQPLNDAPEIRLTRHDNVFTIEFAALEYTNPQRNQYRYRLVGFEEDWNQVSAQRRRATYTNLNPGSYTFQVKASNNSGKWTPIPATLQIVVTPPFWQTWWFRTLLALVLIGLIVSYLRFINQRRQEEHQRQLLEAEQEILKLKNQQLNREVDEKNARLSAALLQSAHKNSSLNELKVQLQQLSSTPEKDNGQGREIRQLIRKIDREMDSEDYWEQFQLSFDQVHQEFSKRLYEKHPQLTPNDIRLGCLIRINMTNREIASIQTVSIGAVEKSKYRLKKKLGLPKDADLTQYILSLS